VGYRTLLVEAISFSLYQGWPTRRSRSTFRSPSLSWSIAPDFVLNWQDIRRTFFNQYFRKYIKMNNVAFYVILYLWLYYRLVDRELSRNFLVDPSRRLVGHPWPILNCNVKIWCWKSNNLMLTRLTPDPSGNTEHLSPRLPSASVASWAVFSPVMCPSHFYRVRVTSSSSQSHPKFFESSQSHDVVASSHFESLVCKLESMSSHTKFHVFSTFFCYEMGPGKLENGAQHARKWCPIS